MRPVGALGYLRTFLFPLQKCGPPQTQANSAPGTVVGGASGPGVDPEAGRGYREASSKGVSLSRSGWASIRTTEDVACQSSPCISVQVPGGRGDWSGDLTLSPEVGIWVNSWV